MKASAWPGPGNTGRFSTLLIHLVASAEMSGGVGVDARIPRQLKNQALVRRLVIFVTLLEPLIILVMERVVLMIVLSILPALMEINQLVYQRT